jgi:hypothetical protein
MPNFLTESKIVNHGGFNFKKFGCVTLEEDDWNKNNIKTIDKAVAKKELDLFDKIVSQKGAKTRAEALSLYRKWQLGKVGAEDDLGVAAIELAVNYEGFLDDQDPIGAGVYWVLYLLNQRSIVDDVFKAAYKTLFKKDWAGEWHHTDLTNPVFAEAYLPIRKFLQYEVQSIDDDAPEPTAEPLTVGES